MAQIHFGGSRLAATPAVRAYADLLPDTMLLEYPATVTIKLEPSTGHVARVEVSAMPDRVYAFDEQNWHPIHPEDGALRAMLSDFDPRVIRNTEHEPIRWIEKE